MCLNPFEVREVLQGLGIRIADSLKRLNPFEVREVLQEVDGLRAAVKVLSQSL